MKKVDGKTTQIFKTWSRFSTSLIIHKLILAEEFKLYLAPLPYLKSHEFSFNTLLLSTKHLGRRWPRQNGLFRMETSLIFVTFQFRKSCVRINCKNTLLAINLINFLRRLEGNEYRSVYSSQAASSLLQIHSSPKLWTMRVDCKINCRYFD